MLDQQCPEAALNAVTDHRSPYRTADDKAYLHQLSGANHAIRCRSWLIGDKQMPGQRRTACTLSLSDRTPEVGGSFHPRLSRQHLLYPGVGTGGDVRR